MKKTKNMQSANNNAMSSSDEVDSFLSAVNGAPPNTQASGLGRLVFALNATASRQRTWDQAMSLQTDRFVHTQGIGSPDVQLVYY